MKFNKLLRATVQTRMPQWQEFVLDYKLLKQGINQLHQQLQQAKQHSRAGWSLEEATSSFTALLDAEVEKVNNFYSDRIEEGVIILHALQQHIEQMLSSRQHPSFLLEQRTACQRSLVSFHFNLLMLQNYVALNFTGVVKILKKFDKKFDASLRQDYIAAIVELPFYRCDTLGQIVEDAEKLFRSLEREPQTQPECAPMPPGVSSSCVGMAVQQPHKSPATAA